MRCVICLFGPPGAGKTTIAHQQSQLTIYDRDDPKWHGDERRFIAALEAVGRDTDAQAVILRTTPVIDGQQHIIELTRATHAYVLTAPDSVLRQRILDRGRGDKVSTLKELVHWRAETQTLPTWPGWAGLVGQRQSRAWS